MASDFTPDYGQCTEDGPYSGGGNWIATRSRCPRPATSDDGLCGPHRTGRRRSDASRARWDAERAQAEYVRRWRREYPGCVTAATWACPLCAAVVQTQRPERHASNIHMHQSMHGDHWTAYLAAGAAEAREGGTDGTLR